MIKYFLILVKSIWVQPHGFFNCSPTVDVPPGACESDVKDTEPKETVAPKSVSNALIAKL